MKKKEQLVLPKYYTILPAEIRYNKNLSPSAKLLYGDICLLASKNGYCEASNEYLAFLYDVDDKTVSSWVSQLDRSKAIRVAQLKGFKRKIYPKIAHLPVRNNVDSSQDNTENQSGSADIPSSGKADNNNTSINTINNINEDTSFSSEDYFRSLTTSSKRFVAIVAIFALKKFKHHELTTRKQCDTFIYSRNSKVAKRIEVFSDKQILEAMEVCDSWVINNQKVDWSLEAVEKQLMK